MKPKPVCQTVRGWLIANLGKHCLGALTGTDAKALDAAVHLIELYSISRHEFSLHGFRYAVLTMQPSTRELAYHAIALVMDWSDRRVVWEEALLAPIPNLRRCAFEPAARLAAA